MNKRASRRTPYNDVYPTCERTCAALRIYPRDMDPEWITRRLNVNPTFILRKGERHVNRFGRERVAKLNGWFLSSEREVSSLDLRRHLDWLLDKVEPRTRQLRDLQQLPDIKMLIQCIWWSAYGQGGPTLWPEQMQRMAALNLECGFDVAFFGEEEE